MITLKEATKIAKQYNLQIKGMTRFIDVKINKKPLINTEAVVGINETHIYIIRKNAINKPEIKKIKLEIESLDIGVNNLYDAITNQYTVILNFKKESLSMSGYIEGDFEELLKALGLKHIPYKKNNFFYFAKKTALYTAVPLVFITSLISGDLLMDFIEDEIEEKIKESVDEAFEKNQDKMTEEISEKVSSSILDKLNPFS